MWRSACCSGPQIPKREGERERERERERPVMESDSLLVYEKTWRPTRGEVPIARRRRQAHWRCADADAGCKSKQYNCRNTPADDSTMHYVRPAASKLQQRRERRERRERQHPTAASTIPTTITISTTDYCRHRQLVLLPLYRLNFQSSHRPLSFGIRGIGGHEARTRGCSLQANHICRRKSQSLRSALAPPRPPRFVP